MLSDAPPGLADDGKRLRQQVVEGRAAGDALLELGRLPLELVVGQRLNGGFEVVDPGDERHKPLEFTIVLGANDLGEKLA